MSERFQFLKTYADSLNELAKADENLAKELAWKIIQYGIYGENVISDNPIIEAMFIQIKLMIDNGKVIAEKNRENGKKGGRPKNPNETETKPNGNPNESETKAKETKIENIKEKIEKENNNIILTNDTETEVSECGNPEINNLISQLKQMCLGLGVAYDKTKERQFAKHILTAKEFGNFCEQIGQDRVTFALNVLKASFQIKFRRGICTGPMKIYQNYADVYNETLKQHVKNQKNLIQSF